MLIKALSHDKGWSENLRSIEVIREKTIEAEIEKLVIYLNNLPS